MQEKSVLLQPVCLMWQPRLNRRPQGETWSENFCNSEITLEQWRACYKASSKGGPKIWVYIRSFEKCSLLPSPGKASDEWEQMGHTAWQYLIQLSILKEIGQIIRQIKFAFWLCVNVLTSSEITPFCEEDPEQEPSL